jgi:hypothetical protein
LLTRTDRGLGRVCDELASFLTFGKWSNGTDVSERAGWNPKYEAKRGSTIHRASKPDTSTACEACVVFGLIQPQTLATFRRKDKEDGILERFTVAVIDEGADGDSEIEVPGLPELEHAIERLATISALDYQTTYEGGKIIKSVERDALKRLVPIPGLSSGFRSAMRKLHASVARYALIIHLLEDPTQTTIPTDTIRPQIIWLATFSCRNSLRSSKAAMCRSISRWR